MGGKGSSFIHYPNGEIQELTGSPLYHTATIINSNIHSGGVSLQQTKEERYSLFCPELMDEIARMMIWELEKLIIRKKCIIAKLATYSSGCIFPKNSKRIGILFILAKV